MRKRCRECGGLHTNEFVCDPILLRDYENLAMHMALTFARTYLHSRNGELQELKQEARIILLKLPQKYRNKGGIQRSLNHKLRDVIRKMTPNGTKGTLIQRMKMRETLVGTFSDGEYEDGESPIMDVTQDDIRSVMNAIRLGPDPNRDPELIRGLMEQLPSGERAVIELTFGLDGKPFSNRQIQKKLNRGKEWVDSRLNKGLERLRQLIEQQHSLFS